MDLAKGGRRRRPHRAPQVGRRPLSRAPRRQRPGQARKRYLRRPRHLRRPSLGRATEAHHRRAGHEHGHVAPPRHGGAAAQPPDVGRFNRAPGDEDFGMRRHGHRRSRRRRRHRLQAASRPRPPAQAHATLTRAARSREPDARTRPIGALPASAPHWTPNPSLECHLVRSAASKRFRIRTVGTMKHCYKTGCRRSTPLELHR
mmetsp:Transcript_5860/g.20876  ORF Transcript_5860/g.20876 Transcript_5860/m.20876 type:complete len:202 (+) Transcript_5860:924-1529(+)